MVALEGTWQTQEASHWRRLSEAKDEWQKLDPVARLVFLAVSRLGVGAPSSTRKSLDLLSNVPTLRCKITATEPS